MTVVNFNYPKFKYTIASTGQPGAGYKLFTYAEDTSTKKTTWTSLAKTGENTNPIILDANGEADVWIDGNYKFVLALPTDIDPPTSPVWTYNAIRSPIDSAATSSTSGDKPVNGSFETDTNSDGVPDNWTVAALSGGTIAIDDTASIHGTNSLKFTSTGAGAGTASSDDYYEVETGKVVGARFSIISAHVDTHNLVEIYWYNSSKGFLSSTAVYDDAATNPTTWTRKYLYATSPASAKFARVVLTGVAADSTTHSNTNFDNIELDTVFTGEITATVPEINVLDGVTATTAEINYLDLTTGPGTQEASKAVVADANVNTGVSKVTELHIGASGSEVQVTATPAELNYNDGATSGTTVTTGDVSTTSFAVNGAFTAGTITCYKVLNLVTIRWTGLTHVSGTSANTTAGLIPAAYRPSATLSNSYRLDEFVAISSSGTFTTSYSTARTSAFDGSITYSV